MIKLALFTGNRAEYGLMRSLINVLNNDDFFELHLLVSSSHVDKKFGYTLKEIEADGIKPNFLISVDKNKDEDMAYKTSEIMKNVASSLKTINPRYLIVLGDRYETFGAASAAHLLGIEIIHLHGGETTLGAIDDKLRNSISQLSTLHFTSADIHKRKVENITGDNTKVFDVGPLVIDGLINLKKISREEFQFKTKYNFSKKNFLITFHPETLAPDLGISGLKNVLKVLENYECNILFTSPNPDKGSDQIFEIIQKFIKKKPSKSMLIHSLGQELYLNALILFDCVIGNSSSGIIEAPLIKSKVLNIGDRQKNRYRFGPVIDVSNDINEIAKIINKIYIDKNNFSTNFSQFKKLYCDKTPSIKIINKIKELSKINKEIF